MSYRSIAVASPGGPRVTAGILISLSISIFVTAQPLPAQGVVGYGQRDVRPIASVLADRNNDHIPDRIGDTVVVQGVLSARPRWIDHRYTVAHLEDASGAARLFARDTVTFSRGLEPGDVLRVRGHVYQYHGAEELVVSAVTRVGHRDPIVPRDVLAADVVGERYAGRLVRVEGRIVFEPEPDTPRPVVRLRDRSGDVPVRISEAFWAQREFVERLVRGGDVTIVGFAGQRDETPPFDGGYRLETRRVDDVVFGPLPPYRAMAFGGFVLLGLLACYLWWRRRAAERRGAAMAGVVERLEGAQAGLEHTVSLLHATLDATADGILVMDEAGRIVSYNGTFATMWRVGETPVDLGDDRLLLERIAQQVCDPEGFIAHLTGPSAERRGATEDRIELRGGRVFEWSSRPQEVNGRVVGRVWSFRDITQRERIACALHESEAHYRSLVENAPYGIYKSTAAGRFLAVNPALVTMLGYGSEDELLALDLARDVYMDAAERRRLVAEHRRWGPHRGGAEAIWKRKDGTPIRVRLTARTVRDAERGDEGFETIVEDVTERRALEEQLRQAQKMEAVGQLTGGIAHDFNNLLTVIVANGDLVQDALPSELKELRQPLADLRHAADRGADMVRKLLAFGRRRPLERRPAQLARVVRESAETLRRVLPEDIDLRLTLDESVALVDADAGAIEQILLNLATNARDAMPKGGMLSVALAEARLDKAFCRARGWGVPGPYVCLTVADDGSGMDQRALRHVFEPFYTTKEVGRGSGLGLAMVYGLVKQHDGFVDVASRPGAGSTFRIYLPCSAALDGGEGDGGPPAQIRKSGGHERILVVEDEASVRRAAERILAHCGYEVLTAPDGQAALELLCGGRSVDLIICDVVMPRLGGVALRQALRDQGCETKFAFMSGYTAGHMNGAPDVDAEVIHKPWSIATFTSTVRRLLDATPAAVG